MKAIMKWWLILFLIYLMPYLTFITIFLSLYAIIVHENACAIYKKNRETIPDPFQNMVHSEELCGASYQNNVYFDISADDIGSFGFPPRTTEELLKREQNGTIRFMAYNSEFQKYHEKLKRPRVALWAHIILNILVFIIMQKLLYEPLFCFSLLHPIDSVMKCRDEMM